MNKLKAFLYRMWYREPFRAGYQYRKVFYRNERLFEKAHKILISQGFQKFSDVHLTIGGREYFWYEAKA